MRKQSKSIAMLILIFSFLLSACSSGQLIGLTITPSSTIANTPTFTPSATITQTPTLVPTFTLGPTFTPSPTITPTPELGHLAFREDFQSDLLGWNNPAFPPVDKSALTYSPKGIEFNYPVLTDKNAEWYCNWNVPQNVIKLSGDAIIETNFDRRVRFSGLHFFLQNMNPDNSFAVIVTQGERTTWKTNEAGLGYLRPTRKDNPWDNLGSIEPILKVTNGNIPLRIYFKGDKMLVYVDNILIASRENALFSGKKIFAGVVFGNGDDFVMNSLQVWVNNMDSFKIVPASANP
jgi:hypothetical protein